MQVLGTDFVQQFLLIASVITRRPVSAAVGKGRAMGFAMAAKASSGRRASRRVRVQGGHGCAVRIPAFVLAFAHGRACTQGLSTTHRTLIMSHRGHPRAGTPKFLDPISPPKHFLASGFGVCRLPAGPVRDKRQLSIEVVIGAYRYRASPSHVLSLSNRVFAWTLEGGGGGQDIRER